MEKIGVVIGRIFILLFMFRVGVTAIEDGSIFLFLISIALFVLYFKLPKLIETM